MQIYITTKKYPFFALLNFLCVIAQMSKLVYVKSVGENLYILLVLKNFQLLDIYSSRELLTDRQTLHSSFSFSAGYFQ